jgi:hypothetical protein
MQNVNAGSQVRFPKHLECALGLQRQALETNKVGEGTQITSSHKLAPRNSNSLSFTLRDTREGITERSANVGSRLSRQHYNQENALSALCGLLALLLYLFKDEDHLQPYPDLRDHGFPQQIVTEGGKTLPGT